MTIKKHLAHISDDHSFHYLQDHLYDTAQKASDFASEFGCHNWGFLCGLWHDIGKYSSEFQKRIGTPDGNNAHIETIGKVDHSTAGAQHANSMLNEKGVGKVIAYIIAGHHGGLPEACSIIWFREAIQIKVRHNAS